MAVGQETGKKEENLSATVLRTLKGESEGIRHVFLTYESSNAAKHWGFCHRKGLEENHTNWRRLRSASAASSSLPYHMMPGNLR